MFEKKKWIAALTAAVLMISSAGAAVFASEIRIISESESERDASSVTSAVSQGAAQAASKTGAGTAEKPAGTAAGAETESEAAARPLDPRTKHITADDAVQGARVLCSQMRHYADVNDYESFAGLFEPGVEPQAVQDQLQVIKSSLTETKNLNKYADICVFDPTQETTQSPYYFTVALCDYAVNEGAVSWYSTVMRVADYPDGWKAGVMPAGDLLSADYPALYRQAESGGRNAVDLYPSLAMRFTPGAVFEGAFYALPNLAWQEENGDVTIVTWIANGTGASKWCTTMDLILKDEKLGEIASVNVPVQQAMEPGQSIQYTYTIPNSYVKTGKGKWTQLSIRSNLNYQ